MGRQGRELGNYSASPTLSVFTSGTMLVHTSGGAGVVMWVIPEKRRVWHTVCARGVPGEPVSWGQSSAVGFKGRSGPALDGCRAVGRC